MAAGCLELHSKGEVFKLVLFFSSCLSLIFCEVDAEVEVFSSIGKEGRSIAVSERVWRLYLVFVILNHEEVLKWVSIWMEESESEVVDGFTAEVATYPLYSVQFFHFQYSV